MTPAIRAAIGALSENDLAILQRDLNGKAQQDRMMPTDHDKLRKAITDLRATSDFGVVISPTDQRRAKTVWVEVLDRVLAAAESTLPKTKTAQVWRAEYCTAQTDGTWLPQCQQFHTIEQRDERVKFMRESPQWYSLITVSGPHAQEIPA